LKFWLVFIAIILQAQNLYDIYRFEGKNALITHIESKLQSPSYWLQRLKDKNLTYGYYQNEKNILVCNKSLKNLKIYDSKNLRLIDKIDVLTGLKGDKEKEGDLKTPIGVYRLVSLLKEVDEYYGPFAFETSYPNYYDRIHGKSGYGIWIHGYPLNGLRESNITKGCIVLKNSNLERLKNEIDYKKSYLLISDSKPLTTDAEEIANILAFIYRWREAWQKSDFKRYKTFYSKDFVRLSQTRKEFFNTKQKIFDIRKNQNVEILFSDINIIPYQNIENKKIFRIDMKEKYKADGYEYNGTKELYISYGNPILIILEK